MTPRKPSGDDLLTARQISDEYGMPLHVAQSLVRNRDRHGLAVRYPEFRRVLVYRRDVEPHSSGGTMVEYTRSVTPGSA